MRAHGSIEGVVNALFHVAGEVDLLELFLDVDVGVDHNHVGLVWLEGLLLYGIQVRLHRLKLFALSDDRLYFLGLSQQLIVSL